MTYHQKFNFRANDYENLYRYREKCTDYLDQKIQKIYNSEDFLFRVAGVDDYITIFSIIEKIALPEIIELESLSDESFNEYFNKLENVNFDEKTYWELYNIIQKLELKYNSEIIKSLNNPYDMIIVLSTIFDFWDTPVYPFDKSRFMKILNLNSEDEVQELLDYRPDKKIKKAI